MREIKFRAWDIGFSKMRDWDNIKMNCNWNIFDSKYFILMQFTGLKDKNGKEIYEGDIVESDEELFKVCFEMGCYGIRFLNEEYCNDFDSCIDFDKMEIIGNIHENLELMK